MPKPRIEKWLPRGGLGYVGIATAAISLIVSVVIEPKLALPVCIVALIMSFWFAIGLRSDYDAGEAVDLVVCEDGGERRSFDNWLLGNERPYVRRISTNIVLLALIGVAIVVYRLPRG